MMRLWHIICDPPSVSFFLTLILSKVQKIKSQNLTKVTLPANNVKHYSAKEACAILAECSSEQKFITVFHSRGFIPIGRTTMRNLLQEYKDGKKVHWKEQGRPAILENEAFKEKCASHFEKQGIALSRVAVCEMLLEKAKEKARKKGKSKMMVAELYKRTNRNYQQLI